MERSDRATVIVGDCLAELKKLQDQSVHCCVTSPPYWGLRDYGVDGQIGLEETPEEYVQKLVEVFREVRRVLRDDGTLWLNLGDTYISTAPGTMHAGGDQASAEDRTAKKAGWAQTEGPRRDSVARRIRPTSRRLVFAVGHHLAQKQSHA